MSFGVGVGDIIQVVGVSWRLYKAYKDSSPEFVRLSGDILALNAVLSEIKDFLDEDPTIDTSRRHRFSVLYGNCKSVLDDLDALYNEYDGLGTHAQRTWDRVKFGLENLAEIRGRLVSSVTMLTAWHTTVMNASTTRINRLLAKFITEVQAGLREGSVVTTPDAAQAIDSADGWKEFRRDLEDVGITAAAIEEKREYIVEQIKKALAEGALDERCELIRRNTQDSGVMLSDSGYEGSAAGTEGGRKLSSAASGFNLRMANTAFEEELKRQRANWRPGEGGGPIGGEGASGSMAASEALVPMVKVRRRTHPAVMFTKLFKNETDIIEAASDGDLNAVAKLIALGMDVNARDRWGWSALSMCGYGGYTKIARLLMDHGADLDNVDVDGDTPTDLAAQRGHAQVVMMIDEERAARDLKVREGDKEVPRRVDTSPA